MIAGNIMKTPALRTRMVVGAARLLIQTCVNRRGTLVLAPPARLNKPGSSRHILRLIRCLLPKMSKSQKKHCEHLQAGDTAAPSPEASCSFISPVAFTARELISVMHRLMMLRTGSGRVFASAPELPVISAVSNRPSTRGDGHAMSLSDAFGAHALPDFSLSGTFTNAADNRRKKSTAFDRTVSFEWIVWSSICPSDKIFDQETVNAEGIHVYRAANFGAAEGRV